MQVSSRCCLGHCHRGGFSIYDSLSVGRCMHVYTCSILFSIACCTMVSIAQKALTSRSSTCCNPLPTPPQSCSAQLACSKSTARPIFLQPINAACELPTDERRVQPALMALYSRRWAAGDDSLVSLRDRGSTPRGRHAMLMIPERYSGSFYPCHRSPFPSICIHVTPRRAWPKPYIERMFSLLCSPSRCFTPCYGDRLKAG